MIIVKIFFKSIDITVFVIMIRLKNKPLYDKLKLIFL